MIPKWLPLLSAVVYYLVAFFLRSWLQYRRTGINPFTLLRDREDTLYKFAGRWMVIVLALILAEAAAWAAGRPLTALLWRPTLLADWTGVALLLTGTAITLVSQANMADSWRIGIDRQHRSALVTHGLFGYSRNPVFVSMLLALTGMVSLVPTYLMAGALLLSWVIIGVQVRLEEAFLANQHGEAYIQYMRKVPRFL